MKFLVDEEKDTHYIRILHIVCGRLPQKSVQNRNAGWSIEQTHSASIGQQNILIYLFTQKSESPIPDQFVQFLKIK